MNNDNTGAFVLGIIVAVLFFFVLKRSSSGHGARPNGGPVASAAAGTSGKPGGCGCGAANVNPSLAGQNPVPIGGESLSGYAGPTQLVEWGA
jgi:hypothetical protein